MRIDFTPKMTALVVSHKGEKLTWSFSAWTQLKAENIPTIHGPLNAYLASMPMEDQDELFRLYGVTGEIFEDEEQLNDLHAELQTIVVDMVNVIDYNRLQEYFKGYTDFQLPTLQEEERGRMYPEVSTYDRAQMHDLHVLTVAIKIISPLMGAYMKHIQSEVGDWKEMACLALFDLCELVDQPAWDKLERYTHNTLDTKIASVKAAAVTHDMSYERLKRHAMGLAIARRLTIARHSDGNDTLIKYISRFVGYQFEHFGSTNFTAKKPSGSGGGGIEDESVADRYRIPEDVPLSIQALANKYTEYPDKIAAYMTVEIDPGELVELTNRLKQSDFVVNDMHLLLVSLVTTRIVHTQTLHLLDRDSMITLAAASSLCFKNMGMPGLSQLAVANRRERNINSMDMTEVNNRTFKKLAPQLLNELAECYPYKQDLGKAPKTSTPGYLFIERLIEYCIGFDWEGLKDKEDIRDEVAKVLINGFKLK